MTLAVSNAKGGVMKTSVAVHVATGLARQGARVLLLDADVQGNATTWLLGTIPDTAGTAEALRGTLPREAGMPVEGYPTLRVLAGGPRLAGADLTLAAEVAGETLLRRALARVSASYDYAVIDCPPAVGLTVVAALVAADAVLVPVLPGFLPLQGFAQLEDTRARVIERLGARADLLGVVLVGADPREAITADTRELLTRELGPRLFRSEVRISTAAKALPAHRRTAWDAGADARGAEDYTAVLAETLRKLRAQIRKNSHTKEAQ